MLVAISGSQGSGKTTVLNALKELGYPIVERKTSRSILSDWGVSLQEVNNNHELTIRFQEEISKRKFLDEESYIESPHLCFTERTHSDLFTYALVTLGKDNDYSDWLNRYYESSKAYNQLYRDVFYLKAGLFDVVHDGTRGSNEHYSRMVDLTMLDFTQQMTDNSKLTIIDVPDLDQRINIITHKHGK